MFLRGTNYIASQWLSEMTREKYSIDLKLMQQANINSIRIHAHIIELWLINDLWKSMPNSKLTYTLQSGKTIVKQGAIDIAITPDSSNLIDKLTFSDLSIGNYQLLVKVIDRQGSLLGANIARFDVIRS